MLRQEASLPSEDEFAENRCGLNNAPSIPPAVSHFAVGWTEEGRNPSPVEDASRWAFAKPQPRPNHRPSIHPSAAGLICLRMSWKAPACPSRPPASEGLSLLSWHCTPLTPGQTWFDQREALVIDDSTTYLQPQQSGPARLLCECLCVGVHVWTTVWVWQRIRNLIRSGVRIFRTEMCRCGSIHMRGSSCPPVVCGATFPKRVTSCEPTLSRLC